MPAKPDVVDEELEPWSGSLEARFEIEDALVEGDFAEVRAAGGRIVRSRLERVELTGSRLRSVALIDVVAHGCEASGADWSGARMRRVVFDGGRLAGLQLLDAERQSAPPRHMPPDTAGNRPRRQHIPRHQPPVHHHPCRPLTLFGRCPTEARRLLLDVDLGLVYRRTNMDARLVTSHHKYMVPQVRELAPPAMPSSPTTDETGRAGSQRDLVAASLLACPDRSGPAPKHGI